MLDTRTSNVAVAEKVTIGTHVEVRNLYLHEWSRGFQVAGIVGDAYLIRRVSDGSILPRSFAPGDIRPR
jgi:hypothetical protein